MNIIKCPKCDYQISIVDIQNTFIVCPKCGNKIQIDNITTSLHEDFENLHILEE